MSFCPNELVKDYKSIGFFGLGRSNKALLDLVPEGVRLTLRSDKPMNACGGRSVIESGVPRVTTQTYARFSRCYTGEAALSDIDEEFLILSPSVRRERREIEDARRRSVRVTSDCELFFENVETPVVAVSGSDGKSTTATLTDLLLRKSGIRSTLVGNCGVPMLPSLCEERDVFVAELSSFMLRYTRPRLLRGVLTNITPNHLDWHADYAEYVSAKLGIYENCEGRVAFIGSREIDGYIRERGAFAIACDGLSYGSARLLYKSRHYVTVEGGYILLDGERLLHREDMRSRDGNLLKNAACAIAATAELVPTGAVREVLSEFSGLAHRCELFFNRDGIDFIDSSIDTTPARCAATLEALGRRVVLILGGPTKGLSYEPLTEAVKKYARCIVLTGESIEEMRRAIPKELVYAEEADFTRAVRCAIELAERGDAVLLSPAATSYDAFASFEERGELFKKIIKDYYKTDKK